MYKLVNLAHSYAFLRTCLYWSELALLPLGNFGYPYHYEIEFHFIFKLPSILIGNRVEHSIYSSFNVWDGN
jgi:hypothetical protein